MVGFAILSSLRDSQRIKEYKRETTVEDILISSEATTRTDRKDAAKIERAVTVANQSSAAIIRIREAQSKLVEKIISANDRNKIELASEFNSLNAEANRISSETSFNGHNLTGGTLFQVQSGKRLYYGVVSLPSTTALGSINNITTSSSSISTTTATLEELLVSAYVIEGGLASRDDKSKRLVSDLSKIINNDSSLKRNKFAATITLAENGTNKATRYEVDTNDSG